MMMNTVRHAACNRSPQEDCDGHVPKAADRSLAKLFLRRGYKLTGGTCSTWEMRFWDLAEDTPERMDTGDMSDLVDRRSFRFLDTAGKHNTCCQTFHLESVFVHLWYINGIQIFIRGTIRPRLVILLFSHYLFRPFRKPSQHVWSPYIY